MFAYILLGHTSLTYLLVHKGAVVNAMDYHGSTPLHMACLRGHSKVAVRHQIIELLHSFEELRLYVPCLRLCHSLKVVTLLTINP